MNTNISVCGSWKQNINLLVATAGAALILGNVACYADPPVTMAPPVASSDQYGDGSTSAAADSVFNWSDVPQNQKVPVDHATFDQGGYQIYDTAGETIVVPFKNNNLYAMKFALSDDGTMYFVNTGDAPVLYVPHGGYLENATVNGARWYPFPRSYDPDGAVYIGPAPSWDAFIGMGWYDGMHYYGGYWCNEPVWDGGVFVAIPGLFFVIGGEHYYGWDGYRDYYNGHPGWEHTGYFNRSIYHWAGRPSMSRPPFGSVDHHFGDRGFGGDHGGFASHGGDGYRTFHGADGGDSHGFNGGNHSFNGGDNHSFNGGDSHSFNGGDNHSFNGGDNHAFNGGDSHAFNGGDSHAFNGGDSHTFNGGDNHTFNGGSNHSFSSGNSGSHTFGGNSSGGGHTFNGGSHGSNNNGHDSNGHDDHGH